MAVSQEELLQKGALASEGSRVLWKKALVVWVPSTGWGGSGDMRDEIGVPNIPAWAGESLWHICLLNWTLLL